MNNFSQNFGGYNISNMSYGKLFIIPQTDIDYEILLAVDRKSRIEVANVYGLTMDYDWNTNTVANAVVETLISNLSVMLKERSARGGVGINFYDLFSAQVSIKTNEKAEKEGNINIMFTPGKVAEDLIKNGPLPEKSKRSPDDDFLVNDPVEDQFNFSLDRHARYNLSMTNGIVFGENCGMAVFAIGYVFIKNIFTELLIRLASLSQEDENEDKELLVSVNFNDNIEFHVYQKGGEVGFALRPGMNAKLLIKCDDLTEHTMGDD